MNTENKYIGACRYCGQINAEITSDNSNDADDAATMSCKCPEAQKYQNIQEQIQKASERVEQLFGADAKSYGFESMSEKFIEFLKGIVKRIAYGEFRSVTVQADSFTTAKISKNDSVMKVERKEVNKCRLEE